MPVAAGNTDTRDTVRRHRGSRWNGDRLAAQLRESGSAHPPTTGGSERLESNPARSAVSPERD